ncbi:hypothetical protein [Streptomyces sp. NPDC001933]|uniref:hypothetical protein n=1 Tax=Streptomyces sp. NPDC001933 TaxID=3364626 RepID=UPI0036916AA4
MFTGNARDFLGALVEAGHPGPQAHEISEHLLMAVKDGTYKKGSALSAKKIAATLQAPVTRVALALADLAHAGYINITATGRATVAGRTPPSVDRALQHASEADPAAIADLALQQAEQ